MIIDFTISNYLSFKDEMFLSLSSEKRSGQSELKTIEIENGRYFLYTFSAIYGPNASGKSNLIGGLYDLKRFIIDSHKFDDGDFIPMYRPFKLERENLLLPVMFNIEFVAEGIRYIYHVSLKEKVVVEESLYFFPEGRKALLFSRNQSCKIKYGSYFRGEKKSLEIFLLPNRSFLSLAGNSNNEILKPVLNYFRNTLRIYGKESSGIEALQNNTTFHLKNQDHSFKESLSRFLNAADLNIKDIKLIKNKEALHQLQGNAGRDLSETEKQVTLDVAGYRPHLGHQFYDHGLPTDELIYFDLNKEESAGTARMYHIAGEILNALKQGMVLIIDEFNSKLHPYLNKFLVELFINPEINKENAQLIVATHDTCILDFERLTREQVWFTDKLSNGATDLYSLDEFDKNLIRDYARYGRHYMNGRFKAVPALNFSKLIDGLK